ncbi:hypothetical protein HID58_054021 [Brassica napus]|uniref:Glutaminyl-tRNA synthetase class Ib non-specific RNA-binding domain-containing protein n=1 Tax=Brassica napus TaxID=3708 RepID=A0ABQ8AH15_BRANA|nr:hypothetical protein HID58_054021 [Brassica napus]
MVNFGAIAPNDDESVKLFLSIGLDEKTVTTTINNPKVTANLTAVIHEVLFLVSPPPSSPLATVVSAIVMYSDEIGLKMTKYRFTFLLC